MTNFLCLDVNGRTKWPQRTTDHGNETRLGIISQESKTGICIICLSLHFVSLFTPLLPLFQRSKYVSHLCTKYSVQNTKPFIIELITNKLIACHLHCFIGEDLADLFRIIPIMSTVHVAKLPKVSWNTKLNMLVVYHGWHHINYVHKCINVLPKSPTSCNNKPSGNNKQAALACWRTASVTFDPSQIAHTPHSTRNQPDLDRVEAVMIHTGTWARVMASWIGS